MENDAYIVCQSGGAYALADNVNELVKLGYMPLGGISIEPWRCGDSPARFYQVMFKAPKRQRKCK